MNTTTTRSLGVNDNLEIAQAIEIINESCNAFDVININGQDVPNFLIEDTRTARDYGMDWYCLTVWIGGTMVEMRFDASAIISIKPAS